MEWSFAGTADDDHFSTPGSKLRRSFGMGMVYEYVLSSFSRILLILKGLQRSSYWPPWCNTNLRSEEKMIRRIYFSHYRGIRAVATATITVGAAMLLGYFILLAGA
jgi:hypothetical protein